MTVGEPEQWLPGHADRAEIRRRARALLLSPAAAALLAGRHLPEI